MSVKILKNAKVFDPNPVVNINKKTDLKIVDNNIATIGNNLIAEKNDKIIDCENCTIIPGIIDIYADLSALQSSNSLLIKEAKTAHKAGITTFFYAPDKINTIDSLSSIKSLQNLQKKQKTSSIKTIGALTSKLQGEQLGKMYSFKKQGAVALCNALYPIYNTKIKKLSLQYAKSVGLKVIVLPQDAYLSAGGCVNDGPISSKLGLPAIPIEAETCDIVVWLELVKKTKCPVHFVNITCAESVRLIRQAKENNLPVTASVAMPYLLLNENDNLNFNTDTHIIPPLRSYQDQLFLQQGVVDGTIDIISSGHTPCSKEQKLKAFAMTKPGISGFDSFVPLLFKLIDDKIINKTTAINAVCTNPARIFNLTSGITLKKPANLVIVKNQNTIIDNTEFNSFGKNTPFNGFMSNYQVYKTIFKNKE
ncbi:MAG: hypothetical protein DRQ51_08120 [Gammaproteobacteria bacterium]|nr:MAG: hypothetical protein DRQ51_08120 [Gammaproteobacteria bacterium]